MAQVENSEDKQLAEDLKYRDLIEKYKRKNKEVSEKIEKEFNQKEKYEGLVQKYRQGIESMEEHDILLNMCIFPFTEKGHLRANDYTFIRADPLFEFGIKNFDFLLHGRRPKISIAVFGEIKSSAPSPGNLVNEIRRTRQLVSEKLPYIRENYLRIPAGFPLICEYVVGVNSLDAPDVHNAILDQKEKIIEAGE